MEKINNFFGKSQEACLKKNENFIYKALDGAIYMNFKNPLFSYHTKS